jgi:hypothetical protein
MYFNLLKTPTIHEIEFISIRDMWCKDPLSTSNECFKWNHNCILHNFTPKFSCGFKLLN